MEGPSGAVFSSRRLVATTIGCVVESRLVAPPVPGASTPRLLLLLAAVTSRGATARQAAATTEAAPTIHCIGPGAPSLVLVPLPHLRTVTTIDQLTS